MEDLSKLNNVATVRFYFSKAEPGTLLHIICKDDQPGFKRGFFDVSKRSAGTNILLVCEVPRPWEKNFWPNDITKKLADFVDKRPDVEATGEGA